MTAELMYMNEQVLQRICNKMAMYQLASQLVDVGIHRSRLRETERGLGHARLALL